MLRICLETIKQRIYLQDFDNLRNNNTDEQYKLLLRKGVYSYEYMSVWDKFEETRLPPKKAFYSNFNISDISKYDYEHAQKVWKEFKLENLGEYHDLYLKTDVLLLSNAFEVFNMFTADSICEMIEFLIDNIFVQFGGHLFHQVIGIPMGTNCAPLLADLFLYSYENEFLDNMIRSGHRRLARSFNLCYRYIDDLIVFNNKKFLDYLKEIYPSQLTVEKANKSDHLADYLDLTFIIDSGGKLSTRLYDKRDDFDFHIVNFPFLSSNIPSGPSYGVYISQLIRYARCCSHYDDFRYRHKCLVDRLLSQGYKASRLEKSFKKFYGRYQDLIEKYQRSVNAMVNDSFPGQFLFNM